MPHQGGKPHKKRKMDKKKPAKANVGTRTGGFPRKSPVKRSARRGY